MSVILEKAEEKCTRRVLRRLRMSLMVKNELVDESVEKVKDTSKAKSKVMMALERHFSRFDDLVIGAGASLSAIQDNTLPQREDL